MKKKRRKYNPNHSVDPTWWSALSEDDQIDLVIQHHRRARLELPDERIHAVIHVIIENQIVLKDETPVAAKLDDLIHEGLSRHDAIHAIGSVLAPYLLEISRGDIPSGSEATGDPNDLYFSQVRELTAEGWLAEWSSEDDELLD